MRQRTRGKLSRLADFLLVIGVICLLAPVIWSLRASILQYWEVLTWNPLPPTTQQSTPRIDQRYAIIIPRLSLNAVVVEEKSKSDLDRGPMHLAGTGQPGKAGNCCIAAHKEKWFRELAKLIPGDTVILRSYTNKYIYVVTGHRIVQDNRVDVLVSTEIPSVTLITCTGPAYFGRGKGRLIVTGVLRSIRTIVSTTASGKTKTTMPPALPSRY